MSAATSAPPTPPSRPLDESNGVNDESSHAGFASSIGDTEARPVQEDHGQESSAEPTPVSPERSSPPAELPLEILANIAPSGELHCSEDDKTEADEGGYEHGAPDELMKQWIGAAKQISSEGDGGRRPSSTPITEEVDSLPGSPASSRPPSRPLMDGPLREPTKAPPKISPWLKCVTEEEGYTFYYNTVTGESSWENPEAPGHAHPTPQAARPAVSPVPQEAQDAGRPYEGEQEEGGEAPVSDAIGSSAPPPSATVLTDLASPSSQPSSIAPSPVVINNHSEPFPSPNAAPNPLSSPDRRKAEPQPEPSPSASAAQLEKHLDTPSAPAWMDDAKNLMKLLQKDSPLPPPPVKISELYTSAAAVLPPLPVEHRVDVPQHLAPPQSQASSDSLGVFGISMSPVDSGRAEARADAVTPVRDGDNDSVASARSAGSRSSRGHHKSVPGQISPAISAGGSKNSSGQSALHITAAACNVKALVLLLDGGFDPDVLDAAGHTALMLLCMLPDPAVAATAAATKKKTGTPADRLACVDALVRHGANLDLADREGNTALHLCVLAGASCAERDDSESEALAVSCMGLLIDDGADITTANADGDSALHLAAKLGQLEMMQVIMDRSNAHHQLHPSPVPDQHLSMKGRVHTNGSVITPASAVSDSSYGASSLGNLTGYTTDTSDFMYSAPTSASINERTRHSPKSEFSAAAHIEAQSLDEARAALLSRANQYPSSEVSVQSLSYSPVSTDLGKHHFADARTAGGATPDYQAAEAKDSGVVLHIAPPEELTVGVLPAPEQVTGPLSARKAVSFAEEPVAAPPLPRSFVDDSVPMHRTLWDTLAATVDESDLSPWGDAPLPTGHPGAQTSPATYNLQYDGSGQFQGADEPISVQVSNDEFEENPGNQQYEQYNGQSEWQPYQSDEGYTYYYNSVTGETRWELPDNEDPQGYNGTEQDTGYYPDGAAEGQGGYQNYDGSYSYSDQPSEAPYYEEEEEEVPVWKQGGGMRTVVVDARNPNTPAWEREAARKAPYSNVRDTNTKLSLAPHSPMVFEPHNPATHGEAGRARVQQQGTNNMQGMADYVHTPVKRDDRQPVQGYGIHDISNKHIFREGRADLMSPPVKPMVSEDTLENALMSPHLTRPPRISASPVPMASIYTPSKPSGNGSYYSPLTASPTAGFFSPTAPTPRQLSEESDPSSPGAGYGNMSSPQMYREGYGDPDVDMEGQILDYGYAEEGVLAENERLGEFVEEESPPLGGREMNSSVSGLNDSQEGGLRHQRAPSVSSLSDDQSDGSTITVRHLEVWNKFFENAIKSGESKKVAAKRQYLLEQYQAPSARAAKSSSVRRPAAQPPGLRPTYTPVESMSKAVKLGNKSSGELWPEDLSAEIYAELIADALMLLSRNAGDEAGQGEEEYEMNELGEYVPREISGPSKDDFTMGSVALIAATAHEDVETVEQLLVLGVYPSCVDSNIRTPLHHAAHNGSDDIVALLNDYGADVDARDSTGQTPLHVACCYGHVDIVRALLESAATPDARNDTSGVPMHFAAASGHIDCIILLREYGASVFAVDSYGTSVLAVAEAISPRTTHVQRVISILRSLSEADTRQAQIDSVQGPAAREDTYVSQQQAARKQKSSHRSEPQYSNPSSPDSSRGRSKRTSKALEIKRLAEREQLRASQPGASRGDASSRGVLMLAEAVQRAQKAPSRKSSRRSKHDHGMELERDEYTYEGENDSSSSDGRGPNKDLSPHSSVASNSSSQQFLDPRKVKRPSNDKRSVMDADDRHTLLHRANENGGYGHIPLKVADTPASPPKALATRREHAHSFSESDQSVTKVDAIPQRNASKSISEDDEDSPEDRGYSRSVTKAVGGMVWGVASSLFGMISGSGGDNNSNLDKIPEEESVDSWKALAPPTDHELRQRGLGFYHPPSPLHRGENGEIIVPQSPRPPDIVAAELDAKIVAYKKGLTPRRDVIVPPNEVILAVDMARAAYVDPSRRPAPLNLPVHPPMPGNESGSVDSDRHQRSNPADSSSNHSSTSNHDRMQSKKVNNGYSMGTSVPDGVRWRYVDVLNTSNPKKKSPSKSPKHRISTVAAMDALKSGGRGGEAPLIYSSGGGKSGTISTAGSTGSGFTTKRKASV